MNSNFDRNVDNPDNYKFGIFYYNPNDSRIILPKRNRMMGWTINFGRTNTYLILIGIMILAAVTRYYLAQ